MKNKYIILLKLLICTIPLQLLSAMKPRPVPTPKFAFVPDVQMNSFNTTHGDFTYYPLMEKGTTFSLLNFNRKFDSILHHNVAILIGKKYPKSIIDQYQDKILKRHSLNVKNITTYNIANHLPSRTVSTSEDLMDYSPSSVNNICLYLYPTPQKNHTLDGKIYIDVYQHIFTLNRKILQERNVAVGYRIYYETKVLDALKRICSEYFKAFVYPEPVPATSYNIEPRVIVIHSDSDLENFLEKHNNNPSQCCAFPVVTTESKVSQKYYETVYAAILKRNLEQMACFGIPQYIQSKYQEDAHAYRDEIITAYWTEL